MRRLPKSAFALFISIPLCILSSLAISYYTWPMEDLSYDLFRYSEDGEENWKVDDEWSFYTNENGIQTELSSNGFSGYLGLSYPGQTFYYSRRLTEKLDDPMLEIDVANRTVSVFLDEKIIYTDCPELDNRIGHITLPMLEYDREEPVRLSLSSDYREKTLTVAQSTPKVSEKQTDKITAYPCEIKLYCGYAYESSLIASTARTILPAALWFAVILVLLAAFIWNAFKGIFLFKLPAASLIVLFQMCSVLSKADFFYRYLMLSFDLTSLSFYSSIGALLLFLALYTSRLRPLFTAATVLQWISILIYVSKGLFLEYGSLYVFFQGFPNIMGFLTLSAVFAGICYLQKRENRFFRHMTQTFLFLTVGYILFLAVSLPFSPDYAVSVLTIIWREFVSISPIFSLRLLWNLFLVSSLAAVFFELTEQILRRRTELAVLSTKSDLAIESYENLRLQSEEVMMIRHDTMKHYNLLRIMAEKAPEQITTYLDDLIRQAEDVRSVISSRNQMLNILLNGKLNAAAAKGIRTEVKRCDAPERLPLSDMELCSLIVNILDNAINAAVSSLKPYIELDFHCRGQHFVFSCKNSMPNENTASQPAPLHKKIPTPEHGYGLKIIQNIMNRFGDHMFFIEQSEDTCQITIIIPL